MSDVFEAKPKTGKGSGSGGVRPGAGRPPGSYAAHRVKSLRERFPVLPLEHMLTILNETNLEPIPKGKGSAKREIEIVAQSHRKDEMAKAAAPYVHPRLANIEYKDNTQPTEGMDLSKLNDEELIQLELIMAKSKIHRIPSELLDGDDPDVDFKVVSE